MLNPKVSVHPKLAGLYRRKVEELELLLEDAMKRGDAMSIIRSLFATTTLSPREGGRGLEAVPSGNLPRISHSARWGPNNKILPTRLLGQDTAENRSRRNFSMKLTNSWMKYLTSSQQCKRISRTNRRNTMTTLV